MTKFKYSSKLSDLENRKLEIFESCLIVAPLFGESLAEYEALCKKVGRKSKSW